MARGVWLILDMHAKKRGSLEQLLVQLAASLRERHIPATFVFARAPAAYPGDALRGLGVEVRALPFDKPLRAALQLQRWFAARPPAVAHYHFLRAYSPLLWPAKLAGAKIAVHERLAYRSAQGPLGEGVKRLRARLMNGIVDLRVPVSGCVARSIRAVDYVREEQIHVVENGVDLTRFDGVDGGSLREELGLGRRPVLACVARLTPGDDKGVGTAIRALAQVRPDACLLVVGEGDQRPWKALAQRWRVEGRVLFLGMRNDVERVMAASDAVVVPSHVEEAFGLTVVEAMASSKPVIVSDAGAMAEVAGDGGLVVPRRDAEALAVAIDRVLRDELLARRLAAAGRRRAESRYGLDAYVERILEMYRKLGAGLPLDLPVRHAA